MNLFENFDKPDYNRWKNQLLKDLKTEVFDKELVVNEIEGLSIPAYISHEQVNSMSTIPGTFPYDRGLSKELNSFNNGLKITVSDEKQANDLALTYLMKGVDTLFFDICKKDVNWTVLFDQIEIQYIEVQLKCSFVQLEEIIAFLGSEKLKNCAFQFEKSDLASNKKQWIDLIQKHPIQLFQINGFGLQQTGANTSQEIAFCLAEAQEILHNLLSEGIDIDTASATIHFSIGIGSQYLFEIAKIKVLKRLWSEIIRTYQPKHNCSYNCRISAHIGWLNKSLKDPYTNFLRQSTEVMSAIAGGVSAVFNHPYDAISANGPSAFATQYCINIPLILKEESYFDKVIDPLDGSYTVDFIEKELAQKAWDLFLDIENMGGITTDKSISYLQTLIQQTAKLRLAQIQEGKQLLIGVNKYPNLEEIKVEYSAPLSYFGLKTINLERDK